VSNSNTVFSFFWSNAIEASIELIYYCSAGWIFTSIVPHDLIAVPRERCCNIGNKEFNLTVINEDYIKGDVCKKTC